MKFTLRRRVLMYLRGLATRLEFSARFLRRLYNTPPADRFLMRSPRLLLMPLCWIRGHRWGGDAFLIVSWRAQFCQCCGEEVAGRTRWTDITERPGEADLSFDSIFHEAGHL